ncbi:MAG: hypothetical protein WC817_03755 [Patescibacteria group bacterium]
MSRYSFVHFLARPRKRTKRMAPRIDTSGRQPFRNEHGGNELAPLQTALPLYRVRFVCLLSLVDEGV